MGFLDRFRRKKVTMEKSSIVEESGFITEHDTSNYRYFEEDEVNQMLMTKWGRIKIINDRIKAEYIYENDYLLSSIINRIATTISEANWWLEDGNEQIRNTLYQWLESSPYSYNDMIYYIIKDNLIYGTSIWKWNGIYLIPLNPKYLDFQREGMLPKIDEYGYPVGYRWLGLGGLENLDASELVIFNLWDESPSKWITPPLKLFYDIALTRLDIDKLIGDASWRNAFPPIIERIGDERMTVSADTIKKRTMFWEQQSNKPFKAIISPYYFNYDILKGGDTESILRGGEYLISLTNILFGFPISLLFPLRTVKAVLDAQLDEYYRWLEMIRRRVIRMYRRKVFKNIIKIKSGDKIKEPSYEDIPNIKFEPLRLDLVKARILGVLGRAGVLTNDNSLENSIRKAYNLPKKDSGNKEDVI